MAAREVGRPVTRAVLSIGSNLDDPVAHLRDARAAFEPWLVAASDVYVTPPWGPVVQDDFRNAVLIVDDPDAPASDWLARAHAAENDAGRTRDVRWGPRTLDVDVIAVWDGGTEIRSDDPVLTLPHPRAAERAFVLVPWAQADPDATLEGRPVRGLAAASPDAADVRPADDAQDWTPSVSRRHQ